MDKRLERITLYEMWSGMVRVNGKPLSRALVGGYTKDFEEFYLDEIHILGDKIKVTEEVVIRNVQAEIAVGGMNPERYSLELLSQKIAFRDEEKLLESLL